MTRPANKPSRGAVPTSRRCAVRTLPGSASANRLKTSSFRIRPVSISRLLVAVGCALRTRKGARCAPYRAGTLSDLTDRLEQRPSPALGFICSIGSCGNLKPLGSTAGCGRPHVRWCGRGNGRNPVTSTRSWLRALRRLPVGCDVQPRRFVFQSAAEIAQRSALTMRAPGALGQRPVRRRRLES